MISPVHFDAPVSENRDARTWLGAVAWAALVSTVAAEAYRYFRPQIISGPRLVEPFQLTPWVARYAREPHDGNELVVTGVALIALFLLVFAGVRFISRAAWLRSTPFISLGFVAGLAAMLQTRSSISAVPGAGHVAVAAALVALVFGWAWLVSRVSSGWKLLLHSVAPLVLVAAVVLSVPDVWLTDYGYFLGPALKLMQGETLGSFYMQYNLSGTLLFAGLMSLGLDAAEMAAVAAAITAAFLVGHAILARRVLDDDRLVWLYVACLVAVRFVWVDKHPVFFPQTSAIRMDLWLPMMLGATAWGFLSPRVAWIAGITWIADGMFGAFTVAAYTIGAGLAWLSSERRPPAMALVGLALPIGVAAAFQLFTFGSLTSSGAQRYSSIHLGFLPIDPYSGVFAIVVLIATGFAISLVGWRDSKGRIGIVLAALAAMHLTYFLGRSTDHSLCHIAATWLGVFFVGLDQLASQGWSGWRRGAGAALALALFVFVDGDRWTEKWTSIVEHVESRSLTLRHPADEFLDKVPVDFPRGDASIVLFQLEDAYYNYRLGLRQHGTLVPFESNVYLEETARWLDDLSVNGLRLISFHTFAHVWVSRFNLTKTMHERFRQLEVRPRGLHYDIRSTAALPPN